MRGSRYLSIFHKQAGCLIFLAMIITLVLTPVCNAGSKGDLSIGKKVYNKYCYYCHGTEGRGDGALAMGLTPHPANFIKDTERMKKSDRELFESISKGVHREIGGDELAMPQWNLILTEDEIWSVLAYVRYLSEKGQAEDAKGR